MTYLLTNNFEQVVDQLSPSEANGILAHFGGISAEDIAPEMSDAKFFGRNAWLGRTRQSANPYTLREAMRTAWTSDPDAFLAHGVTDSDRRARLVRGELLTPSDNTARSSARKAILWTTPGSTRTGWLQAGYLWWNSSGLPGLTNRPGGAANIANANVATFGALCAPAINADYPSGHRCLRINSWPLFPKATLSPGGETVYYLRDGQAVGDWPGLWYDDWIVAAKSLWETWLTAYKGAGGALDVLLFDAEYQLGRWWVQNGATYEVRLTPGSVAAGRNYTVTLGAETFTITAPDSNALTLCNLIAVAWNALTAGSNPGLAPLAATGVSAGNPYVRVIHDQVASGYGVPTALTPSATGGGTFAKTLVPGIYFPHPNYPAGDSWYANLKGDARLTDAYIAAEFLPSRSELNNIENWTPTGNPATSPPGNEPTYRFNEATHTGLRKAIQEAFYEPLLEVFPDCHVFDYEGTGKCGGVLPSSDPTSPFGAPVGMGYVLGTHQSRNIYTGVNQGSNTRSDCYVPGTGLVQQSRISEVRYTPSGGQVGAVYRAQLIGFPSYNGVLTTTNIDYTVGASPTAYSVAQGMAAAWNASAVGHVAQITATAVNLGSGNGYVKYTNDPGNQTCEEITFSVVSGTGSGTRTLQVAGAFCRVLDDWWLLQGMLASSSKRLVPYILGASNATTNAPNGSGWYSHYGPKWNKAINVLTALVSDYVAFWNTGSSATSDAIVEEAIDEAIEILEDTRGTPLVMPVRTSYDPDTPIRQDFLVNGRIKRFTLDKYGDYTVTEQPKLDAIGNKSIQALSELTFTASATGGDGADLSYSLSSAPSGATINADTGAFSWTPSAEQDEQTFGFAVVVSDATSGLTNKEWIQVQVTQAPNQPPTIDAISTQSASEHTLFTLQVEAEDDFYNLDYTLADAPAGMSINSSTGLISWTPNETHGGNSYTPTVIVRETQNPAPEDFTPLSASRSFTVNVSETNTAPVMAAIPAQQGAEGSLLSFQCSATDADDPAQTLTFSLPGSPPSGASITSGGLFTWTPNGSQSGVYTVTIRVTDNGAGNLYHERTVSITISESNQPPVIVAIPDQRASVGELLAFQVSASDPNHDTLTYSIADDVGAAPSGLTIGSSTGLVTWTPLPEHSNGVFLVYIRVADNGTPSFSALAPVTIHVLIDAPPPAFASVPNYVAYTGQLFSLAVAAEGGTAPADLTYTQLTQPVGDMALTPGGLFTWTPTRENEGYAYLVCVQVSDIYERVDSVAFYVTVQRPSGVAGSGPAFSPALFTGGESSRPLRRPRRW